MFTLIQELETQRKDLLGKNAELENELQTHVSGNRREKVAENVEHIRLWRQMKQQTEQLVSCRNAKELLESRVDELKKLLDDATKCVFFLYCNGAFFHSE